jgi:hypothetical protein
LDTDVPEPHEHRDEPATADDDPHRTRRRHRRNVHRTSQQDFRGFVSTRPIHSLAISAPDADIDGNYQWGVFDNLVVGSAR